MLYETLRHSLIFFGMLYFGIMSGVFYQVKQTVFKPFKAKWVQIAADILFCITLALLFLIGINFVNYGEIRLFLIISFILGFYLTQISIKQVVASSLNFVYNFIITMAKKIKLFKKANKNERKHLKTNS